MFYINLNYDENIWRASMSSEVMEIGGEIIKKNEVHKDTQWMIGGNCYFYGLVVVAWSDKINNRIIKSNISHHKVIPTWLLSV